MPNLSKRAAVLQESAIRKLDLTVAEQHNARFYRLNIGQPDVPTPAPVLDAIQGWRPDVISYGPASGLPAMREAAAAYHRAWCPSLTARDVAVTTGGSEALLFAFTVICNPGDELLVPEPYYTNYTGFATVGGAVVKPIPTSIANGFALPSNEELDTFLTERTRAIVFSNPGNPTGAVYGRSELERVVAWAKQHDIFVVADEVYRRIWFDGAPPSALELDDASDHVVVIDSLSKTYSACGLRLGFLISRNADFMEKVERLGQARLGPQPLAQAAGLAALSLDEHYYEAIRHTYRSRVDAMFDALSGIPGVTHSKPQGAFYTMVGLPIHDAEAFARFLVTDFRHNGESVVVAPGPGFYATPGVGRNEIRLAAVVEEQHIRRAVELIGLGLSAFVS